MPAIRSSNDNGRSLEFFVTAALQEFDACSLTERASRCQIRDAHTSSQIDPRLRKSFLEASRISADWVIREIGAGSGLAFEVDRTDDSDTGVADLIISSKKRKLLVSVKHNHDALSHPRPYSLIEAIGFRGTKFESDHRDRMNRISDRFRKNSNNVSTYSAAPTAKLQLYYDACDECSKSVSSLSRVSNVAEQLFNFLVAPGCKKLVVRTDSGSKRLSGIDVFDYTKIDVPTSLTASVERRPRAASLVLGFNNGWVIDMRIHTASSRISTEGQLSLKFDVQRKTGTLPPVQKLM